MFGSGNGVHCQPCLGIPTGEHTRLDFLEVKINTIGSYFVCWWSGTGVDSMENYKITAGVLTVGGPVPNQEFSLESGVSASLTLTGTGHLIAIWHIL